jgi:hypothetical protein
MVEHLGHIMDAPNSLISLQRLRQGARKVGMALSQYAANILGARDQPAVGMLW